MEEHGRHRVWYDEEHEAICSAPAGPFTVDDAVWVLEAIQRHVDAGRKRHLLLDLSELSPFLSIQTRRELVRRIPPLGLERQAFVLRNPMLRLLAKTIAKLSSVGYPFAFFETREEGLAWLTEVRR